jgi:peptidoglycan/LPS O-acetylase OafA/YrhL
VFAHQNYFALFTAPSPLNHTWSLAIEEQFYALWPLLFVVFFARTKTPAKTIFVSALGLGAVSTVLMIALYDPANPARVYFGTDTRATAILLGAALAAWNAWRPPVGDARRRFALECAGFAGAIVLLVGWARVNGQTSGLYRGGFVLFGLSATFLIAAAAHPQPGPLSRVLSFGPLCGLGLISYGLYLYHWPIDVALDAKQMGFGGWPLFAFQTAVALVVSVISYRVIEQPIRRGVVPTASLRLATPAAALVVVVAIVASTVGAVSTTSSFASVLLTKHPLLAAQKAYDRAPPGSARVLLVGDSVAETIGPAFEQLDTVPRISVLDAGVPGCEFPPQLLAAPLKFPDGTSLRSTPCNPETERKVISRFRPNVVIWLMTAGRAGTYQGKTVQPCDATYNRLYRQALEEQIPMLRHTGAAVFLATTAYSRAPLYPDTDAAVDCDNALRKSVAPGLGARVVDLGSYICPEGRCKTKLHGALLRPDGLHFTGPGGVVVAKWLIAQTGARVR